MSAVSQGVSEGGGRVVGLPMRHWDRLEPNRWNAELRWSDGYGARLDHLLRCAAVIALPGGVGTLSEVSVIWAAAQTEATPLTIVLLGEGWPPLLEAFRKHLVVGRDDLKLLRIATNPEEAVAALTASAESDPRPGPRG
jgi:predicted Rossmann-fold nucleotide-binding protein